MHLCLNRATCGGGLPLEEFLSISAEAGFPGADVDLNFAQTHGATALRDLYESKRLKYGAWGLPFDWRGEENKQAEGLAKLSAHAKLAAELKIDSCATWLMPSSKLPFIETWNFHVSRLKPAAAILADHGLRLGLEFIGPYHLRRMHPHEFIYSPGAMLELADAIGPNVGLLVDVFHCHTAGATFEHLSQIPGNKIVLAHLNDAPNVPATDARDGNRVLPGEGGIDLPAFMAALAKAGYDGPVSLEVFSAELKAMPPADAAKKAWAATKKALPQYAK